MWEIISSVLVQLLKLLFEAKAKRKIGDEEFLKFIDAHQKKKSKVAQSTNDFEEEISNISKQD